METVRYYVFRYRQRWFVKIGPRLAEPQATREAAVAAAVRLAQQRGSDSTPIAVLAQDESTDSFRPVWRHGEPWPARAAAAPGWSTAEPRAAASPRASEIVHAAREAAATARQVARAAGTFAAGARERSRAAQHRSQNARHALNALAPRR